MNLPIAIILFLMFPELIPETFQDEPEILLFDISSNDWKWYVELFCYRLMIPITGLSLLKHVPKSRVKYKTILTCLFFYIIMEAFTGIIDPVIGYDAYETLYMITFYCMAALLTMTYIKKYIYKSDKIDKNNVYLCFHTPVTGMQRVSSLFGLPFGGICVYTNGYKYGFKINQKTFQATKEKLEVMQRAFTVIDTGILYNDVIGMNLRKLIGTKAGKRISCVWTLRHVLAMLGPKFKPSWWSMFPPVYSIQVML